jgi:MYXO-CTERM domain-containing protein
MSSLAQIQEVVASPVVSADTTSPEAKLARAMKATQVQSEADSKFDTVVERFAGCACASSSAGINRPLLTAVLVVGLFLASSLVYKRR